MSDDHHSHDEGSQFSDVELRVRALESLLVDKGLVRPETLDKLVDTYETKLGPRNGARVVARAWTDPAYRQRLRDDASAAIAELGYGGMQGEHMVVVENAPQVHNVVVCTLCSCYPWPRVATGLVQVECLPLSGSDRSAQRIEGVWGRAG